MFPFFSSFQSQPTAILTRSKVSIKDVKKELQIDDIDTSKDDLIKRYLNGVKGLADGCVNRTFLNLDGTPQVIPDRIETWIIKQTAGIFQKTPGLLQESDPHIGMVQWADKIDYSLIIGIRANVGF